VNQQDDARYGLLLGPKSSRNHENRFYEQDVTLNVLDEKIIEKMDI